MTSGQPERLLYIMNHYSPGGATHFSHLLPLLNEIARQGTTVRLLIEKADGHPEGLDSAIECVVLPRTKSKLRRSVSLFREVRSAVAEGYHSIFVRIAAASALTAIFATLLSRARVYFWQSGTTIEFDRSQPLSRSKLKWYLTSRLPSMLVWRLCHRFVTGPEPMLDYYERVGRVPRSKLALLYNDVDLPRFAWTDAERNRARMELRNLHKLSSTATVVLFVHRLSPVRRTLDYLPLALLHLRSLHLLEDTCLLIVGGGGDLPRLQSACKKSLLDDHVRFSGEAANDGIEDLYAASDLFIQPSHAEGFPRVLLEAMASGLPIATTGAGGSGYVLGPLQQSFVTDPDDFHGFADALARLLRDREQWEALARENLEFVQRFSTPVVAAMYREVLFS